MLCNTNASPNVIAMDCQLAAAHAERKATVTRRCFFQQVPNLKQHLDRHARRQCVDEVGLHAGRVAVECHEIVREELQFGRREVLALHAVENGSMQLLDELALHFQVRQRQRLQQRQHVGQASAVGIQRIRHVVECEAAVSGFLCTRIARGREECLLTQRAQCPLDARASVCVQAALARCGRQQLRHRREIEQRLVRAAERLLQVR